LTTPLPPPKSRSRLARPIELRGPLGAPRRPRAAPTGGPSPAKGPTHPGPTARRGSAPGGVVRPARRPGAVTKGFGPGMGPRGIPARVPGAPKGGPRPGGENVRGRAGWGDDRGTGHTGPDRGRGGGGPDPLANRRAGGGGPMAGPTRGSWGGGRAERRKPRLLKTSSQGRGFRGRGRFAHDGNAQDICWDFAAGPKAPTQVLDTPGKDTTPGGVWRTAGKKFCIGHVFARDGGRRGI